MDKETIILGAGESGIGAALLAKAQGHRVFVSDAGTPADHFLQELFDAGIEYEAGGHDRERILAGGVVIKSPGIPDKVALVKAARAANIPVISEIEFAFRFLPATARVVAITGSNGKTTTTLLTHHLLQQAGVNAVAGGNLGTSFARLLLADLKGEEVDRKDRVYVLELSSFQLDGITSFRPSIGAVLNITPDHLDRYDYQLEKYAASKLRMTAYQTAADTLMIYGDDPVSQQTLSRTIIDAKQTTISNKQILVSDAIQSNGVTFDLSTTKLRGKHNALNALFAIGIAQELGCTTPALQSALNSFEPAAHRMEEVRTLAGVTYINDSKATNVDAVYYALDAMSGGVVWIAGGTDKGNDYAPLKVLVEEKVHTLICLGIDNTPLKAAFANHVDHLLETQLMSMAVDLALKNAHTGDTVLLSPACASFDLFRNYIDRGDQFRAAVNALLPSTDMAPVKSQNNPRNTNRT